MRSKKILALVLGIALCVQMLIFSEVSLVKSHAASTPVGDVSGDTKVNSTDYLLLKQYILGIINDFQVADDLWAADVNGDQRINSTDFLLMKQYLLGIINKFPKDDIITTPTSVPVKGNVTYTLVKAQNPTADQLDAYAKIQAAMDKAISYYNTYTTITKTLRVSYEPSVSTADGNINGSIRFGSNRSYMNHITAMHEIAHTVGVGTSGNWSRLIVNNVYTGTNATAQLRAITGDNTSVLKGDSTHFWPYGLNYTSEVKSEDDLINHCKIVEAMKKDGL